MDQQKKQKHVLMNKAFFYLRFRARSESEMRQYLLQKAEIYKYNNDIVEQTIKELKKSNYINDFEFAQAFVHSRSLSNPKGNYAITQELKKKGVAKSIIEDVLRNNEIDEALRAHRVLLKKHNILAHLPAEKRKQRALGYLQRRGFSYDVAKRACDAYFINKMQS